MKGQAIAKINKMGKIGKIISNILVVLVSIALVLVIIATIVSAVIPRNLVTMKFGGSGSIRINMDAVEGSLSPEEIAKIENGELMDNVNFELSVEGSSVSMDSAYMDGNTIVLTGSDDRLAEMDLKDMIYIMISGVATVIMALISIIFAGRLCKAFEKCESPFDETIIKRMRYFAYSLFPWVLLKSLNESMLSSFLNGKVDISFTLDLSTLLIIIVILGLTYIFRYGAVLQQESDETL